MQDTDKKPRKIDRRRQIGAAIRTVLGINFNPFFINLEIGPERVTWLYALQFRSDEKKMWHPRIIHYYIKEDVVAILTSFNDGNATYVGAETILTMADRKTKIPSKPSPEVS